MHCGVLCCHPSSLYRSMVSACLCLARCHGRLTACPGPCGWHGLIPHRLPVPLPCRSLAACWHPSGVVVQLPGCDRPRVIKVFLGSLPCDMPAGAAVSASVGLSSMCLRCHWKPTTVIDTTVSMEDLRMALKVSSWWSAPFSLPTPRHIVPAFGPENWCKLDQTLHFHGFTVWLFSVQASRTLARGGPWIARIGLV